MTTLSQTKNRATMKIMGVSLVQAKESISYLIGLIQVLLLACAGWATSEIKEATRSINELNVHMATLLEQVSSQKAQINKIERRVDDLESQVWRRSR